MEKKYEEMALKLLLALLLIRTICDHGNEPVEDLARIRVLADDVINENTNLREVPKV